MRRRRRGREFRDEEIRRQEQGKLDGLENECGRRKRRQSWG